LPEINLRRKPPPLSWQRHFPRFPIAGAGSAIRCHRHNAPLYPSFPAEQIVSAKTYCAPRQGLLAVTRERRIRSIGTHGVLSSKAGRMREIGEGYQRLAKITYKRNGRSKVRAPAAH